MPVPKRTTTAEPRVLLRDVVYGKLRTAIEDGTLEPGERLNDEELTTWLGVSRTPVREAIARLETEGLIEMAANRYTRVASLSGAAHDDAAALLNALHTWALAHAGDVNAAARKNAAKAAAAQVEGLTAQDVDAYRALQKALGVLVAGLGNDLFTATESAVRGRVVFNAAAPDAHIDWSAAAAFAQAVTDL